MENPVFNFKNSDGIEYEIHYGKPIFTYKKNGKIKRIRVPGTCDNPTLKSPKIIIDDNLTDKEELETIIEEIAHSFSWEATEKQIRPFAGLLAKFLYKQGWRKTHPND